MSYQPNNPNGQTTMSASAPVVFASDQTFIPTINSEIADFTGTFTNATQTNSVTATGLDGYGNILISINGTYGTATAVFEGSDDSGTTWYPVDAAQTSGQTIDSGYTSLTNISRVWQINVPGFDSVRVRSTAVASGTVNVRMSASSAMGADGSTIGIAGALPAGTNVIGHVIADSGTITTVSAVTAITNALPAGTNLIGSVSLSPATSGGWSASLSSALSTTVVSVKSSAGTFGGYFIYNPNSSVAYVQVFNIASGSVTLNSSTPFLSFGIPATSGANLELSNGIAFSTAISVAATTTPTGSTANSSALVANFWYK